jgi:Flp pilus assembly protein TadG
MMKRLSSFLSERAGNVTIELALMAPILASMLIGLVDLSTAYSDKLRLEQIAQRTIEKVMQQSFKPADVATLKAEAEAGAGQGATANVTYWLECNAVKKTGSAAYAAGCADGEQYARYVQVDITKYYTPLIIHTFGNSNADGTMTIRGIAGLRFQ